MSFMGVDLGTSGLRALLVDREPATKMKSPDIAHTVQTDWDLKLMFDTAYEAFQMIYSAVKSIAIDVTQHNQT